MSYNRHIVVKAILLWTLGVTILRGLRHPGYFAMTYWLVDYRFGFIKRGLLGSILSVVTSFLDMKPTKEIIVTLSFIAFILYFLALIILGLRIINRARWSMPAILTILAFFSSPSIVINAFTIGLFDNTIFVLVVISITLLLKGRIFLASCLQAVSILVHESSLLTSYPVFCLAWLLFNQQQNKQDGTPLPFWPLILPVGAFFALALNQEFFLPQNLKLSLAGHFSEFPFLDVKTSISVSQFQTETFSGYYAWLEGYFSSRMSDASMYGVVLPSILVILFFIFDAFGIQVLSTQSIVIMGVCLLPQLIHMVALDTLRIWAYSIPASFLTLWVYTELLTPRINFSPGIQILWLTAMIVNISVSTSSMDYYTASSNFSPSTRLFLYAPLIGLILIRYHCWAKQGISNKQS